MSVASRQNQSLADQLARFIYSESLDDIHQAKHKFCQRYQYCHAQLPDNATIHQALLNYMNDYQQHVQRELLLQRRQTALDCMLFLVDFEPRLTGSVLWGSAVKTSSIQIHIFADTVEAVLIYFLQQNIPYKPKDYMVVYTGNMQRIPGIELVVEEVHIQVLIFSYSKLRQAPDCKVFNKPMQRMNIMGLKELIAVT